MRIENLRDGLVQDYRARVGVEDTLIVVFAGAEWALDRSALWNAAEVAEKRRAEDADDKRKRRMIGLLFLAVAAQAPAPVYNRGLHMSGAVLEQLCTGYNSATCDQCESYIVGVLDGFLSADDILATNSRRPLFFCPTQRIEPREAVRIVQVQLASLPAGTGLTDVPAPVIVRRAFAAAYPCPTTGVK